MGSKVGVTDSIYQNFPTEVGGQFIIEDLALLHLSVWRDCICGISSVLTHSFSKVWILFLLCQPRSFRNDQLCVEWDVKQYTVTCSLLL